MKVLLISLLMITAGTVSADVFIDEDFESGSLPGGWQVWQEGDTGAACRAVCAVGDSTYMPDPAHSGTHYAWHDDNGTDYSDSWMVTDTYDFSTFDVVHLTFYRYAKYPTYYNYTGLYYSTVPSPGVVDFTEYTDLGGDNFDQWWEFVCDFSTMAAGESNFTIAWVYRGYFDHAEAIDDVFLEATATALENSSWGAIKTITF